MHILFTFPAPKGHVPLILATSWGQSALEEKIRRCQNGSLSCHTSCSPLQRPPLPWSPRPPSVGPARGGTRASGSRSVNRGPSPAAPPERQRQGGRPSPLVTSQNLPAAGGRAPSPAHLSAQDAVHHDDDEALQRVEDGEEDLEEGRPAVGDGEHGRHPGQRQQRQHHAGAPQRSPGDRAAGGAIRAALGPAACPPPREGTPRLAPGLSPPPSLSLGPPSPGWACRPGLPPLPWAWPLGHPLLPSSPPPLLAAGFCQQQPQPQGPQGLGGLSRVAPRGGAQGGRSHWKWGSGRGKFLFPGPSGHQPADTQCQNCKMARGRALTRRLSSARREEGAGDQRTPGGEVRRGSVSGGERRQTGPGGRNGAHRQTEDRQTGTETPGFLLLANPALPTPGEELPQLRRLRPFLQGALWEPPAAGVPLQPGPSLHPHRLQASLLSAQEGRRASQGAVVGTESASRMPAPCPHSTRRATRPENHSPELCPWVGDGPRGARASGRLPPTPATGHPGQKEAQKQNGGGGVGYQGRRWGH